MRYISLAPALVLYTVAGQPRHEFINGELIIEDATTRDGVSFSGTPTSGYVIDAFDKSATNFYDDLQFIKKFDLDGTSVDTYASRVERCGQGTLSLKTMAGTTLGNLQSGYGIFFESPIRTSATTVSMSGDASGAWFQVLTGHLGYNGSTYRPGQVFQCTGTGSVSGIGTFAATFLPEWLDSCNQYLDEAFMMSHTHKPDDFKGYYDKGADQGHIPNNSNDPASDDFWGQTSNY